MLSQIEGGATFFCESRLTNQDKVLYSNPKIRLQLELNTTF